MANNNIFMTELSVARWTNGSGWDHIPETLETDYGTIEQVSWTCNGLARWIAEIDDLASKYRDELTSIIDDDHDYCYWWTVRDELGELVEEHTVWRSDVVKAVLDGDVNFGSIKEV